jgi:hypothetical protein
MALPEQLLLKRRLQILDDETRDGYRIDPGDESGLPQHDGWIASFMARLAALVTNTGRKH